MVDSGLVSVKCESMVDGIFTQIINGGLLVVTSWNHSVIVNGG